MFHQLLDMKKTLIYILKDRCRDCGICAPACPQGAIVPDHIHKYCTIDDTKCIRCGECEALCPLNAIKEKSSPLCNLLQRQTVK